MNPSLPWFIGGLLLMVVVGLAAALWDDRPSVDYVLGGRQLGRYEVGLSAAATGNSGFIMLGAVGLGYSVGLTFVCLPLAWLLGDLVFWHVFPGRINAVARESDSQTLPDLLVAEKGSRSSAATKAITALIMGVILVAYGASQFLAAGKTLEAAYGLTAWNGMVLTALVIAAYCVYGGFRSSVWTDLLQAVLMVLVTGIALVTVFRVGGGISATVTTLRSVSPGSLVPFQGWGLMSIVAFVVTFALSALGFGLSQPQVTARYFAGRSPVETRAAMFTYIAFLQFTWVGMTVFGLAARAVVDAAADPEVVLLLHANASLPPPLVGLVLVGVFAAIASTLDSVALAVGGLVTINLLAPLVGPGRIGVRSHRVVAATLIPVIMVAAASSNQTVFQLSAMAVTLLVATVAPAVVLRLFAKRYHSRSAVVAMVVGVVVYAAWDLSALGSWSNSLFPGAACVPAFTLAWLAGLSAGQAPAQAKS